MLCGMLSWHLEDNYMLLPQYALTIPKTETELSRPCSLARGRGQEKRADWNLCSTHSVPCTCSHNVPFILPTLVRWPNIAILQRSSVSQRWAAHLVTWLHGELFLTSRPVHLKVSPLPPDHTWASSPAVLGCCFPGHAVRSSVVDNLRGTYSWGSDSRCGTASRQVTGC